MKEMSNNFSCWTQKNYSSDFLLQHTLLPIICYEKIDNDIFSF